MECTLCHGRMAAKTITYSQFFEGQFILVENVPAWVCEQCGDTLFEPDVVEKLQNYIWSHPEPVRALTVPLFDLALAG